MSLKLLDTKEIYGFKFMTVINVFCNIISVSMYVLKHSSVFFEIAAGVNFLNFVESSSVHV